MDTDDPTRRRPIQPPRRAEVPARAMDAPARRAGPRWWVAVIPVAAVAAALALALLFILLPEPSGPSATMSAPTPAPGQGRLVSIDSTTVHATASSVLPPAPPATFVAENTLDGDLSTAWKSDGDAAPGVGATLTYRFAEPVRLGRIDLANGDQAGAQEYARDARVKTVTVTTDRAQRTFNIGDSKGFQQLEFDFGMTGQVTLRVDETYPGTTDDIAISEVVFYNLG